MEQKNFKLHYIPALDGLRCIAIVLVMFFHAGVPIVRGGYIGVDMFFVLSGFLITSLLLDEAAERGKIHLKYFYIRRALRLFPALLVMLLVFLITSLLVAPAQQAYINAGDTLIALFYAANWAQALGYGRPDLISHTWSLSTEEQFYLIWPLTMVLCLHFGRGKGFLTWLLIALMGATWLWRNILWLEGAEFKRLYCGLDTRADPLLSGCLFAVFAAGPYFSRVADWKRCCDWLGFAGLALLLAVSHFFHWKSEWMNDYGLVLVYLGSVLVLLGVIGAEDGYFARLLSCRVFTGIGKISYGLYLWHYPIFRVFRLYGCDWDAILFYGSVLTVLASVASYYLIERPCLKRKTAFQAPGVSLPS